MEKGTPASMGGNGYDRSNGIAYPFMYDLSVDSLDWSECSANNIASDRRILMGLGPFDMEQGSSYEFSTAVIWARDTMSYTCDELPKLVEIGKEVQAWYDNERLLSSEALQNPNSEIQIFPNPSNGNFKIDLKDQVSSVSIFDTQGRLIRSMDGVQGVQSIEELKTGLYLIQLLTGTQIESKKVVVRN